MKTFTSIWSLWKIACEVVGGRVIFRWCFTEWDGFCKQKIEECQRRLAELREDWDHRPPEAL